MSPICLPLDESHCLPCAQPSGAIDAADWLHTWHQHAASIYWFEKVYFREIENSFPSTSPERIGHFVGFNQKVGHALTYAIFDPQTKKILYRSEVRSATSDSSSNLRANNWGDDDNKADHGIIRSTIDDSIPENSTKPMEIIDIDELIGHTFEMPDQDGEMCKAIVIDKVCDFEKSLLNDPRCTNFKTSL